LRELFGLNFCYEAAAVDPVAVVLAGVEVDLAVVAGSELDGVDGVAAVSVDFATAVSLVVEVVAAGVETDVLFLLSVA
jgi:hypothetical protein